MALIEITPCIRACLIIIYYSALTVTNSSKIEGIRKFGNLVWLAGNSSEGNFPEGYLPGGNSPRSSLLSRNLRREGGGNSLSICHHYHNIRTKFLDSIELIDTNWPQFSEKWLSKFFYSFFQLDQNWNRNILNSSIEYIVDPKRFESSLFKLFQILVLQI